MTGSCFTYLILLIFCLHQKIKRGKREQEEEFVFKTVLKFYLFYNFIIRF